MPVFTATATALLASTALAGSFIATNLLASGLAYGAGHLLGVFDVPDVSGGGAEDQGVELRLAANTQNRLPTLYGEWMERGRTVYAEVSDDKQNYHTVVALGEGPVDSIDKVFWNEYELTFDANGVVTDAVAPDGTSNTQYNGNITVQTYLGTATGNNSTYLEGLSNTWTSTDKMTNIVYAVISLKYNRDAGLTSLQDMRFVGTSPVSNPADAIEDLLTNSRYGLGLSSSDINADSFAAARNHYDDMVNYIDTDGVTVQQTRHEVNGSLATSNDVINRIQSIGRGCNTELTWSDGQWGLFVNRQTAATSFVFDTSNIVGNIQVVEPGLNSLFNRIELNYGRNSENNYQRAEAFVEASAAVLYPNELTRTQTVDLPLVATSQEAKRVGTLNINQARQQLTVSHTADATAMPLEAGDVVSYTDVDYGWDSKLFRITSITEINEEASLTYQVTAIEYADAIYNFVVNEDDVAPNVPENDVGVIEAIDDLVVLGTDPADVTPTISLNWTVPDNSLVERFNIFYNTVTTLFNSNNTKLGGVEQAPLGNYVSGSQVTHDLIGVPTADVVSIWVVAANDFSSSIESNTATVEDWNPFADIAVATELLYRYNETPSVIAGSNIDVGAPPANETGTGTGRNNDTNDTGWYEFDPEASDRENAPVWTATTQATRQDALPRIIEFTQSGVSGDVITEGMNTNQVTDFGFSGTIGNRTTLYNARPSIDTFTITGDPADLNTSDAGVEPVWFIDATGTTDATSSAATEQFFFYPQGTSSTEVAETFSFASSGNTAVPGGSSSATGLIIETGIIDSINDLRLTVNGNQAPGNVVINDFSELTTTTSASVVLSTTDGQALDVALGQTDATYTLASPSGVFTFTNGTDFLTVTNPYRVVKLGAVFGGLFYLIDIGAGSEVSGAFSCNLTNPMEGDTGWSYTFVNNIPSTATITLDTVTNTYVLPNNLTGAAAVGDALNTLISTDFDTGWVKTFDVTSGVITFTADDFTDRTGSSTSVSGSNGTFNLITSNTPSSGGLTTVQFVIATESIDVTHTVPAGLTGTDLFTNIMMFLSGSTAITDEFTVDSVAADIPGFTNVTVIRLTANDNTNHSLSTTISSGMTGTLSGSLVDGNEATIATTINITYDSVLMPIQQNITFGANTNNAEVAAELTSIINGHAELVATQGSEIVQTTARVGYFQSQFNFDTVSTTFTQDLTSNVTLLKSSLKQVLAIPVLTVTTQGTGTATFSVNEEIAGRVPTAGNPMPAFTSVDIIANGQVAATAFPFPDGNDTISASIIMNEINNNVAGFSATRDGAVITVTSDTNVVDRLSLSINAGVNAPGRLDGNDLASSRTQVNIGSANDVFGGQSTIVTLAIGGATYYSMSYNGGTLEDIIDDLVIGLNTVDTDFNDRFAGLKTDSVTLRATAEFVGATPMITATFTDGSTATADSIGNITTVNSTLGISNTEITPGDEFVILSGELSTFSVTQGTTALITDMEITGASTAAEVSTQISNALSPLTNFEYEVVSVDEVVTAASLNSVSVPTLTLTIDAGLNSDNTAATLATAKVITQMESTGDFDLTNAIWEYAVTSPTTDGDTTMITPDGTIAVRRGLFLNSLAASRDGVVTNNTEVIFGNDLYTTDTQASLIDVTGVMHFYVLITAASDDISTFLQASFQYTTDTTDLPNATWTTVPDTFSNRAFAQVATGDSRVGASQYVSVSFGRDNFAGLTANTQYAFRVLLEAIKSDVLVTVPTNVAPGLSATFQLQEILTTT